MLVTLTDKITFIQTTLGSCKLSKTGKNIDIWCPFCAPVDRSKKKLSIRLSDDANHCWTCDWKARSLAPLLKKLGLVKEFTEYVTHFNSSEKNRFLTEEEIVNVIKLPSDFELLPLANRRDPDILSVWRHVESRGLTEKDMWYHKIGVSNESRFKRRVIVPSFDSSGHLNYYVSRAVDAQRQRYDNPDVKKNDIIFNEINVDWNRRLVLCEGVFDSMKCGSNVVPLLGSSLNEESLLFNKIITHNTPIALALDANMIHTKTPKIIKKLSEYDVNVTLIDVRPFRDPGQMQKEDFALLLRDSIVPSWDTMFSLKLNKSFQHRLTL